MNVKYIITLSTILLSLTVSRSSAQELPLTPPLGWNSYNCFGSAVRENEVKENADYMAKYLKPFGWNFIVVDFYWSYENPEGSLVGNPQQSQLADGSYIPWLRMDEWGRLLPHERKFPSAWPDKGFKPLGDYIHSKGLQFGIHIMRGVPRQAVWAKSPVLGAPGITADMIADTTSVCSWSKHMYGVDMSKKGAQEYLNSLLKLYAGWGIDYIKIDDLSRPYHKEEIEGYHKAIKACGRPVVFSTSPGITPRDQAAHVSKHANLWRLTDDFWDEWKLLEAMFDVAKLWEGVQKPGHWPDMDMLSIGRLSKRGPVGEERYSKFTNDELLTHYTLWCIFKNPLMIGGNLPDNRDVELTLFTNKAALDMNQNGINPRQLFRKDQTVAWVSDAPSKGMKNLALFNLNADKKEIEVNVNELGFAGQCEITDVWNNKKMVTTGSTFSYPVNAHGTALFRIKAAPTVN